MGVHTEWARATSQVDLITEEEGWSDNHGQGLDPGNVGLAFAEVVVEGTREELADFARRILALVTEDGPLPPRGTCILTGAAGEDPDDCTTHRHEAEVVDV